MRIWNKLMITNELNILGKFRLNYNLIFVRIFLSFILYFRRIIVLHLLLCSRLSLILFHSNISRDFIIRHSHTVINWTEQRQNDWLQYHSIKQAEWNEAQPGFEEYDEVVYLGGCQRQDRYQSGEATVEYAGAHLTEGFAHFVLSLFLVRLHRFGRQDCQVLVSYVHRVVDG